MRKLRGLLCLLLAISLFPTTVLAETYTDDWGNGVTLNFEIDDSLLQPLDIFDAYYKLPLEEATDEQISAAKDLLQQTITAFGEETPEIHEDTSGSLTLRAYDNEWGDDFGASYCGSQVSCINFDEVDQYMYMESYIDDQLSEFSSNTPDCQYPAEREDFYVEHDCMTHEDADAKAQSFMSSVRGEDSPFGVELRDWYGITHEQFADYLDWAAENNQFKEDGIPSYFAGNDWTEKYDAYYLLYSYTYKGYPICDNIRTGYTFLDDSLMNPAGYATDCLINRDGFVYASEFMLFDCDYAPYEDTPALTLYEALDVLKSHIGIISLNPIEINRVYVEYIPYYVYKEGSDTAYMITFEPVWNFVATITTTAQNGTNESSNVYRVNAHTGQIMTNGYGVIE